MNLFSSKFASRGSMKQMGSALERIADCLELICSEQFHYNARPPKADKSGPDPELMYTNEEADVLREIREELDRRRGKRTEEEEQDKDIKTAQDRWEEYNA